MTEVYTEEYTTILDNAAKFLEDYGVCVVPNILSKEDNIQCVNEIWDYLEYASEKWNIPINRNKKNTWDITNFSATRGSMLIQHHSIGHAQFAWNVRQNPNVVNVFATLWECEPEDLITSFDGVSISMPPEDTGKKWTRGDGLWLHSDTSYVTPHIMYQSWVTPIDVRKGDATLAFLSNSHKYHSRVAKKCNITDKNQWHMNTKEELDQYYKYGCELKKIMCPAGSIVLWDSRLIHCGMAKTASIIEENAELLQ